MSGVNVRHARSILTLVSLLSAVADAQTLSITHYEVYAAAVGISGTPYSGMSDQEYHFGTTLGGNATAGARLGPIPSVADFYIAANSVVNLSAPFSHTLNGAADPLTLQELYVGTSVYVDGPITGSAHADLVFHLSAPVLGVFRWDPASVFTLDGPAGFVAVQGNEAILNTYRTFPSGDYIVHAHNFARTPPIPEASGVRIFLAVPEPSSIGSILIVLGIIPSLRGRRP